MEKPSERGYPRPSTGCNFLLFHCQKTFLIKLELKFKYEEKRVLCSSISGALMAVIAFHLLVQCVYLLFSVFNFFLEIFSVDRSLSNFNFKLRHPGILSFKHHFFFTQSFQFEFKQVLPFISLRKFIVVFQKFLSQFIDISIVTIRKTIAFL
ncbi:hypothetical protein P5673_025277 [Acropora cervicornis]|uniref:Uncharacterized protein n=1 Tax=Acropora cervicornis TaxID=6130 RepID=A0AAD9Q230_ACRCE|nr:hypothetical protein P5673_025277 [Acropora cervicornis]